MAEFTLNIEKEWFFPSVDQEYHKKVPKGEQKTAFFYVILLQKERTRYLKVGTTTKTPLSRFNMADYKKYNFRDAVQYMPSLIVDGKILTKCTAGWGMQPRTIVAQRSDGVVMFLVVDGRKPGYSIGITMQEAAELLLSYGAVTAGACDGGSSSVLAYNGEIINKPSKMAF